MTSSVSLTVALSPIKLSMFERLPDEMIQNQIACYLGPKNGLSARLVNRRFAVLFGDNHVWRAYYRALGLKPPEVLPNPTGSFSFSDLAKKFSLWTTLQKSIDFEVEYAGQDVYRQETPRSLCIATLIISELLPLHDYAIKTLKEHCRVPADLSVDELVLRVARGAPGFKVNEGARILALRALSGRAAEPTVREALLSVITTPYRYIESDSSFCSEAVKGLMPYLPDPEIEHAILIGLQQHGPQAVRTALDILITQPEFLNTTIDKFAGGLSGLHKIVCSHLNNPFVVEQLMLRLAAANNFHIVGELAVALSLAADQESVQRALCQKLTDLGTDDRAKWKLERSLCAAPLTQDVLDTYRESLPKLQELAEARVITNLANDMIANRQELFAAMSSPNESVRAAAAIALAPLVPDDSDVLAIFLERIYAKDFDKVGTIIVFALAKVEYREDICTALIKEGPLDGRLSPSQSLENPALRLATVQALRSFVDKPEVRQAFLDRLRFDEYPGVRCALIDILAPQLENEDVQALFLDAAQDKLWRQSYHLGTEWQVAAIDKLGSIVNRQEVKEFLLQLFSKSTYAVKAACIRVLCSDPQKPLLKPSEILAACVNDSSLVREEAHRALILWVTNQQ